jgi:hypothetical protein
MLTAKLTELIERDWEEIVTQLIAAVRRNPDLESLSNRSDHDLREWCRDILEHLGNRMSAENGGVVHNRFEAFGRINGKEYLPLHEVVLLLQILKDEIVSFIHECWLPMTAMQINVAEELEEELDRFFDECVYRLVRSYERAMRLEQALVV